MAQHEYQLIKIGTYESDVQLYYFYSLHARPLIIINRTIYLPHDKCLELRHYGGSYAVKDIAGNTTTKTEGGDQENKDMSGVTESKNEGGDDSDKHATGDQSTRSSKAENDLKSQSGQIAERQEQGGVDVRSSSGENEAKVIAGDESSRVMTGTDSDKSMSGDHDERTTKASGILKSYGGYSLFIKCRDAEGHFDLVNYFSDKPIRIFDINGLHEVNSIDIFYDQ